MSTINSNGVIKITYRNVKGKRNGDEVDESIFRGAKRLKTEEDQHVKAERIYASEEQDWRKKAESNQLDTSPRRRVVNMWLSERKYFDASRPGKRMMLYHEPPIFDYVDFDHYDAVQNKFKEEGGRLFT